MSILSLRKSGGNVWGKNRDKQAPLIDSELLPGVFANHNTDDCMHVLDVGLGVADTVEVLQQFRCKVYFLDLGLLSGKTLHLFVLRTTPVEHPAGY